ncbi:MAG TPA: sialidase family protein [Vicinamibacterales bacterium]
MRPMSLPWKQLLLCGCLIIGVLTAPAWTQTPVTAIATPAAAASSQPQLTVSKRGVLLSWIERAGDLATLKFAERTATGWTPAVTVASGRDWFVNWADVPSVLRLPSGTIVAHWLQKSAASTYAYDVRLSYSTDDGKTWSKSFTPHHDGTPTEHGFASMFPLGDGLGLVWLDGRGTTPEGAKPAEHSEHGGGGAMSVRFARFDKTFKQLEESVVDARVCECCPTTAAVTAEGIITAFRNRSDDEVRDNYVSRFVNGKWSTPQAVFNDGWKIAACPVNGPSLSANGNQVAMTWFTVKKQGENEQGQAYAAFSQDAGKTFGKPIRVDDGGTLGRVDIEMFPDGSALASWIEFADQRAQFRSRRIESNGTRAPAITIAGIAGSRSSGYPRAALANGEVIYAWTESTDGGGLRVQTASAKH